MIATGVGPLVLLAACSGSKPAAVSTATPSRVSTPAVVSPAPAGSPALTAYYRQPVRWRACGGGFSCATVRVPLDYAAPAGSSLGIAVVRLPATGKRIGSLLINPGGPGGSGVSYARAASSVLSPALRQRFDIVGFDPRGVGQSDPIRCVSDAAIDAFLTAPPAPRTPAETSSAVRAAKRIADGCRQQAPRLLAHVGTLAAARDMDVLRGVLGEAKLTYLGKSYGTYLGAKYASLFPTRVRALVLDGALDPSLSFAALNAGQGAGFETDLRDFLRYCGNARACGSSPSDALSRLDRLLARVRSRPLPAPSAPGHRRLTYGEAIFGMVAALYSPSSWPYLSTALQAAERGDGSGLLQLSDQLADRDARGHFSNQLVANTAVNCLDRPSPRSLPEYAAAAAALRRTAPHFGPSLAWGSLVCTYWPVPAVDRPAPVRAPGAPPILVVGTTRDPATPYAWAVSLSRQLPGALLTYEADGHTAYRRGSACVDSAVDAYLISQRLPAAGTRCR